MYTLWIYSNIHPGEWIYCDFYFSRKLVLKTTKPTKRYKYYKLNRRRRRRKTFKNVFLLIFGYLNFMFRNYDCMRDRERWEEIWKWFSATQNGVERIKIRLHLPRLKWVPLSGVLWNKHQKRHTTFLAVGPFFIFLIKSEVNSLSF